MKRPIILVLISFIIGFLCFEIIEIDIYFIIISLLILLISFYRFPKETLVCIIVIIFSYYYTASLTNNSYRYKNKELKDISSVIIEKRRVDKFYTYIIKLIDKNIKVSFMDEKEFDIGDILVGSLDLSIPKSKDNYRTFSYRRFLKSKKVFLSARGNLKKTNHKNNILKFKSNFHKFINANVDKKLINNPNKFAKSIVLAQNIMDKDLNDKYFNLGIGHILAVSGLHISLIISFLDFIAKALNIKRKIHFIIVTFILLIYGFMISFPVSLLRALIMFIIRWTAIFQNKLYDKLNSIFASLFICLIINPYYLYASSLYLSFSAIFSIMYLSDLIKKKIHLKAWIYDNIIACIAIQVGMFPIQIYLFNKINLLNILANLLIIPLAFIPVLSSFIISFLSFDIFNVSSKLLVGSVYLIDKLVNYLYEIKFLSLAFPKINLLHMIIYYSIVYFFFNSYKYKKRVRKKVINYSTILLVTLFVAHLYLNSFLLCRLNFIDVGQGDAILFRTDDYNIMVDLGGNYMNPKNSAKDLVSYLQKNGVLNLDAVFLTHDDFDHVGNYNYLSKNINIKKLYGISKFESIDEKIIEALKLNQKLDFNKVQFEVLSGSKNGTKKDKNNDSLGMRAKISKYSVLLTGDIEEKEMDLADEKIDILKVGHHGSNNTSSQKFLDAIKASHAIISAGQNNRYGHPHKDLIKRLKNSKIKIYSTIEDGNVEITFYKDFYKIKTFFSKKTIIEILCEKIMGLL